MPLQMHVWSREWVTNSVHTLHHAFLPCLWRWSGNMSLCLRKQEQTVPYAHANHNLHIKCFSVWGLPKEFAWVLCACIFLLLWVKNNGVGTNDDAVLTSVNAVNDFHFEEPGVLFRSWDLGVWSLKVETVFFQPLQDKHTRMCLRFVLIWTASVLTLAAFLLIFVQGYVISSTFSVVFYDDTLYCWPHIVTICLHWSACTVSVDSVVVDKSLCSNIIKMFEEEQSAFPIHV